MRFTSTFYLATSAALLSVASLSSAQSTTSAAATPQSSYIPTSGASPQCTQYMSDLNSDDTLEQCIAPLLEATNFFAKSTNDTAPSSMELTGSLDRICSASACDSGTIRKKLSDFYSACRAEVQATQQQVLEVYDFLYLINPFRQAVCTKDDSQKYCLLNIAPTAAKTATTKRSLGTDDPELSGAARRHDAVQVAEEIVRRQTTVAADDNLDQGVGATAASSSADTNIAFLFLQPDAQKDVLCSSCTKNILAAYIEFETSIPYAIGLSRSSQLKGQSDLYKSAKKTCGNDFTVSINQIAGTTAFSEVSAAGKMLATSAVAAIVALLVSVALLF
ncbi:hypothetical protein CBOM_04329 [Ceraceosorus bombacis]|uniref:DUF7729 domain-containing protein n=1 Tax=Ceraceosorus bombacis TaxID=401625 RepID=A0A0N7LAZ4_9BASI|nr:hypothetical protein CBOM_04329 [Ceraceosorus bombacis]